MRHRERERKISIWMKKVKALVKICSITKDCEGGRMTEYHEKHRTALMRTIYSPSPRTIITWGERGGMCVRGRDAYTGADLERAWPIDHIKLPAKVKNQYVFKGEASYLWCMSVGFIDTARRVQRDPCCWKRTITFRGQVVSFPLLICNNTRHLR